MGYQKNEIRESWAAHREEMREEFQHARDTGRGITIEEALLWQRRGFEAGANAMLDAITAENLRRDLAQAEAAEHARNIIPIAAAS